MNFRVTLILLGLLLTGFLRAQKLYVWTDLEPTWYEKSIDYWKDVNKYGNNVPEDVIQMINEDIPVLANEFELKVMKVLTQKGMDFEIISNPTELSPPENGLYMEITARVKEVKDLFPFYHKGTFSGNVEVVYSIEIINASGKNVFQKEVVIQQNLRKDISKEQQQRMNYFKDVEGYELLISLSMEEGLTNLLKNVDIDDNLIAKADPNAFTRGIQMKFKTRKVNFPRYYQSFAVGNPIVMQRNDNVSMEEEDEQHAAFNSTEIANELAVTIRKVRNYAVLIGINEYADSRINDLDNPISDAMRLQNVLLKYYNFLPKDVIVMKNATRVEIISKLDELTRSIEKGSNLLIFYAGHGIWDEDLKKGYWIPSDARMDSRANWISNNDMVDYIGGIPSRHSLLIADACFSGSIFKTREVFTGVTKAVFELYRYPGKKAMTSGAMKTVPDKSVFIEYLVRRLENNRKPFLPSEELFNSFKTAVINNSPNNQIPQFGEIQGAGDEGGDFIFIKRY